MSTDTSGKRQPVVLTAPDDKRDRPQYTRAEAASAFEWLRAKALMADVESRRAMVALSEWARLNSARSATVPTSFSMTPQELAHLFEFAAGKSYNALEDTMDMTIGYLPEHEGGPGWYVWASEYPEEGSVPIHAGGAVDSRADE